MTCEGSLALHNDRLYLLRRVDDYKRGYVKHFPFLESENFRKMSLHAQRFVLYTLWSGVHTGRPLKRAHNDAIFACKAKHGRSF